MSEQSCLFCRIAAKEIPADFVYQDDRSMVIRDVNPQAPSHLLVIPLDHIESLDEASQRDEALLGHLLRVAARVANSEGLGEGGYRTVINNGEGAGQSVFHLHVHVLGGRALNWPPG
ncbi:MAG TPA: histidine triad nucleotide-binding protein [Pyrinomonadaceae bacterium]|jgi:histidine triad (HIT) family protein|nr:histidine triad nucleotide-binding protein [Pyrinomonadaceae bacterium]